MHPSLPRPEHCSDPGRHTGSSSNPRQDMQGSYMCSEERAADGLGKSAKWKKWPEVPPNTRPRTRRSAEMCSTAVYQSLEIQKGNPTALESTRGSVERKISEEEATKLLMNPGPTPKLHVRRSNPAMPSLSPQPGPTEPQAVHSGRGQLPCRGAETGLYSSHPTQGRPGPQPELKQNSARIQARPRVSFPSI